MVQNAESKSSIISAMSKTFLIGEYCVVFGGDAIVLVTPPEFKLIIHSGSSTLTGVNKLAPAFLFYKKHISAFKNMSLKFIDPHNGTGGLGASSAQFAMLYKLYLKKTNNNFDINTFLHEYKHITKNNIVPSGVDCLAQYDNQNIYFNGSNKSLQTIEWNFKNIDFCILKTGVKITTHEHLNNINKLNTNLIEALNIYVRNVKNSFINQDATTLCTNINLFYQLLDKNKFVIEQTQYLVKHLLNINGILAVKGCGAMLADTLLIIFETNKKQNVMNAIKQFSNLTQIYTTFKYTSQ